MGRIIAIGGGFGGKDNHWLCHHIMELCGKEHPNYLQIPTPCYDGRDTGVLSAFFNNGCNVDVLCVTQVGVTEEIIAEKIRKADIINVPGGNLKYCITMWKQTGTDKYLKEAYEQGKILFGTSTGAMCWFREGYDDCGVDNAFMFHEGLDLLPYCVCPHYESESWHSFQDAIKTREISGISCENEAAICFIDDRRYILTASARTDARCWYFDAADSFKTHDLCAEKALLESL